MTQHTIEQEKEFNILKNSAGELMILIQARMEDAAQPRLAYNGGRHAVLYRNDHNTVILDYIHPDIRAVLDASKNVLIVETRDGAIIREYISSVRHLKEIPLPNNLVLV